MTARRMPHPPTWRHAAAPLLLGMLLAAAGPAAANSKAGKLYEDALVRFEKQDMAGAIIQLKNAIQADRKLLPVHVLLGRALLATGEVAAAEAAFGEALNLGVNRAEVVLPMAEAVVAQGKQQEIVDQARFQVSGLPPGTAARLLLMKAGALSDLGDARRALQSIEEARTLDPLLADTWLAEVPVRIRARQFKEAQAAVDKARTMAPDRAEVHHQQAAIAHVLGDRNAALAAYDKALAADANHLDARVARAGLYLDLRRNAEAAKDVDELLKRRPLEPRGWYLSALLAERDGREQAMKESLRKITNLLDPVPVGFIRYRPQLLLLNGQAHYALGNREKAKPLFEAFNRVQPGSPVAKLLANILLAEGNHDRAIEALDQYLRAFPGDSQAMALLASAHMARGRHARAAQLMQDALKRKDEPELYTAYGLSLMGTGQRDNAVTQLETAYRRDPGQTQAAFALVGLYLGNGQAAKALQVADGLVKRAPGNPSFQNLLGQARFASRDLAGSRAAFEKSIQLDPTLLAAKLNLARLEMGAGQLDRAQQLLDEVLKVDERHTEAMVDQAQLAQRRGQLDNVQRWLQKGMDVGGVNDLRPGLALVELHLRQGRRDDALKVANQLLAAAPENLQVLMAAARAQLAAGDAAGARRSLTNATRVAQFNAPLQVEIALLQLASGNLPGATYSVEKALSEKPDFLPAQALMAELEMRQGELAKAEQRAQQLVRREPKLSVGYGLLGDIALARKQVPAAITAFRQAHQAQPTLDTLGRLAGATALQDVKASLRLIEDWVQARPKDTAARNLLAESYVRAGDMAQAKREYEALRSTSPQNAVVLNNLANVLLRLKDPQALAVAEQAMAAAPGQAGVIDTAGWAALQAGQVDKALGLLRDARLRDPENGEIRYHLAAALAAAGRKAEARAELDAALASRSLGEGRAAAEALRPQLQ